MRMGGVSLCVGLVTMAIGCSGSPAAQNDLERAQHVLDRYIAALKAGDVDTAMEQRCAAKRVADDERALFLQQARDVIDMAAITGVTVSDATLLVGSGSGSAADIHFDYTLTTRSGSSEPLHGVAVDEGGTLRLCGYAQTHIDKFATELTAKVASGRFPSRPLRELMPPSPPDGYRVVDDHSYSTRGDAPGVIDGWTRAWQTGTFGGARVSATRYRTPELAAAALRATLEAITPDVTERFEVVEGIGTRRACAAWTWLQPPSMGYQCDEIVILESDTVLEINAAGLPPAADHSVVFDLASEIPPQ